MKRRHDLPHSLPDELYALTTMIKNASWQMSKHLSGAWVCFDVDGWMLFGNEAHALRHAESRGSEVRYIKFGERIQPSKLPPPQPWAAP